jgi:hypothetical protein
MRIVKAHDPKATFTGVPKVRGGGWDLMREVTKVSNVIDGVYGEYNDSSVVVQLSDSFDRCHLD